MKKITAVSVAAVCLSLLFAVTAFAAPKIEDVEVNISYETFEEGDYCNVDDIEVWVPEHAHYEVESTEITNQPSGEWKGGKVPKLKIILTAKGDRIFSSNAATDNGIAINCDNTADVYSAKRYEQNTELHISVKLDEVISSDDDWGDSDSKTVSPGAGTTNGAWLATGDGRWWYCNADRTFTRNGWQKINYRWYYFDANGIMLTGWQWIPRADGHFCCYYLCPKKGSEEGACYLNCRTPDGYYVNASGEWIVNGVPVVK